MTGAHDLGRAGARPTADQLQEGYNTVRRWRDRFLEEGCQGIEYDAPGRGRKPVITAERKAEKYLARHNAHPKPFVWKATHADILGKLARAKAALLSQRARAGAVWGGAKVREARSA